MGCRSFHWRSCIGDNNNQKSKIQAINEYEGSKTVIMRGEWHEKSKERLVKIWEECVKQIALKVKSTLPSGAAPALRPDAVSRLASFLASLKRQKVIKLSFSHIDNCMSSGGAERCEGYGDVEEGMQMMVRHIGIDRETWEYANGKRKHKRMRNRCGGTYLAFARTVVDSTAVATGFFSSEWKYWNDL